MDFIYSMVTSLILMKLFDHLQSLTLTKLFELFPLLMNIKLYELFQLHIHTKLFELFQLLTLNHTHMLMDIMITTIIIMKTRDHMHQ